MFQPLSIPRSCDPRNRRGGRPAALTMLLLAAALAVPLHAQDAEEVQFITDFNKGIELSDDKLIDKAVKRSAKQAMKHCGDLAWERRNGRTEGVNKCELLDASWKRCFEGSDTLQKVMRWVDGCEAATFEAFRKTRAETDRVWRHYTDVVSKDLVKADYLHVIEQLTQLANNAASVGHYAEIADIWGLASVVGNKMPDKTIEDRERVVAATEAMLAARKQWNYTFDNHFITSTEFAKFEKLKIEEDRKKGEKRAAEGYAKDVKGIDALLLPGAPEAKHALAFEPLANLEEVDYCLKGGPVPAFWWMVSTGKEGSTAKLPWFRRAEIHLARVGANKFGVSLAPDVVKGAFDVEMAPVPKISNFWLDSGKKMPYAMAFWIGGEREMVNEAECNLMPGAEFANVYFRSASSWKTKVGAEELTFYDDNASGAPVDGDPFELSFKSNLLGKPQDGTVVPLFDSMRIGKGPRQPQSAFVKLAGGWFHLKRASDAEIALRPLNPEYVKTGRIKLSWSGPKPTAPMQLVVQGSGDLKTAFFDVSGGKEVEVPAGNYTVVYGRLLVGKAPRLQTTTLYQGSNEAFAVEAGKVFELKMGAPFTLRFERSGEDVVSIPAPSVFVAESSGCVFADNHGMSSACDVAAAKAADGKGAKVVGKFLRFTDPEIVNAASKAYTALGLLVACMPLPEGYKSGEMVLKVKLPAPGMKVQLSTKKHPLFGAISSAWL